jgi:hypothetical protein
MRKQEGSLSIEYYSIFPMHCSWAMRPAISLTKRPVTQLSRQLEASTRFERVDEKVEKLRPEGRHGSSGEVGNYAMYRYLLKPPRSNCYGMAMHGGFSASSSSSVATGEAPAIKFFFCLLA